MPFRNQGLVTTQWPGSHHEYKEPTGLVHDLEQVDLVAEFIMPTRRFDYSCSPRLYMLEDMSLFAMAERERPIWDSYQ